LYGCAGRLISKNGGFRRGQEYLKAEEYEGTHANSEPETRMSNAVAAALKPVRRRYDMRLEFSAPPPWKRSAFSIQAL
jgi:hypothetical protein